MPIPQVFGTEHEYVINVTPAADYCSLGDKWRIERAMAIELLADFWEAFFPGLKEDENLEEIKRCLDVGRRVALYGHPDFMNGFMTPLGGRFYIDHGYFEGSSPEVSDPFELLACEIAQDDLLAEFFARRFADHPLRPRLYKNVSDGQGHSQAAHRNFCVSQRVWHHLVSSGYDSSASISYLERETRLLLTWHVVEQIFGGAGKFGDEAVLYDDSLTDEEAAKARRVFQISGRADFAQRLVSGETTHFRPIVNQRNEPLADPHLYGRYHCINGDATRAHWSHLFKMGLTAIFLGMLEDDFLRTNFYVEDPILAIREVSRDSSCKKPIRLRKFYGGGEHALSPLDVMGIFLAEMDRYLGSRPGTPSWAGRILEKAKWAHWALTNDSDLLGEVLDWKIKELLGRGRPNSFSIHLNYHSLFGPHMLYSNLVDAGAVETVISREEIEKRKVSPPESSRAYFRGKFVGLFFGMIDHYLTDWNQVFLKPWYAETHLRKIMLQEPLGLTRQECGYIFEGAAPPVLAFFENMLVEHRLPVDLLKDYLKRFTEREGPNNERA